MECEVAVVAEGRQPEQSTIVSIPTSNKQVFRNLEENFSRFAANVEVDLDEVSQDCLTALIPLKNWDQLLATRQSIAKKIHMVRAAVEDVGHMIDQLKLELKCCPFPLPTRIIDQQLPDFLVSMTPQQVENMLGRQAQKEFADREQDNFRKLSQYQLEGGKVLPKTDEAIKGYIEILSRLSTVSQLVELIDFPDKNALKDLDSFKKWFKPVRRHELSKARAYVRLCAHVKEREECARASFSRGLLEKGKLDEILNVAQKSSVDSIRQLPFIRLLKPKPPSPEPEASKSKKRKQSD